MSTMDRIWQAAEEIAVILDKPEYRDIKASILIRVSAIYITAHEAPMMLFFESIRQDVLDMKAAADAIRAKLRSDEKAKHN